MVTCLKGGYTYPMEHQLPPRLKELIQNARIKHLPKGQIVFYQDDVPREVYLLKQGIIKVHNIDDQGNEKILHLLKPPALAPLAIFSGTGVATRWFYTALTDCEAYVITTATLYELMNDDIETTVYLMNWFSREVHELLTRLDSLSKTNVNDKLVAVLKFLAVHHSTKRPQGWLRVNFPVSHQLLADIIGVTRESAATSMKELADAEVVRNPRLTTLEIHFERLVA